jgi:hypothetical protein
MNLSKRTTHSKQKIAELERKSIKTEEYDVDDFEKYKREQTTKDRIVVLENSD